MKKMLYAYNRGINLSSGICYDFDDGNLDPEITNRIVRSVVIYGDL